MSATTAGALKAHLEAGELGLAFYRDRAPQEAALPYGVISEAISITPIPMGDKGDPAADLQVDEQAQVSVYETWRGSDGKPAEDYPMPGRVHRRLEGARLETPKPGVVTVIGRRRLLEVEGRNQDTGSLGGLTTPDGANVVANHITVLIRRDA